MEKYTKAGRSVQKYDRMLKYVKVCNSMLKVCESSLSAYANCYSCLFTHRTKVCSIFRVCVKVSPWRTCCCQKIWTLEGERWITSNKGT